MKRRLVAVLCCWCGLAALRVPLAATPPPSLADGGNKLADGGNKLADGDTEGAIRSLQQAVRAAPGDLDACRLLSIALLHARRHDQAADAASLALGQPGLTPSQRAVDSLLLGKARYAAFQDDFEKCTANVGDLPNMAQLLSQMATHKFPTAQGDVIITQGDVNAQDDFNAATGAFRDTVTRMQKRLEQADAAFKDALAADPKLAGAHDGLGVVRAAQGFPGEARREFLTEIALHGPSGPTCLHLGGLDASESHDDDAIENLRRAVALAPELEAPYKALAPLYAKLHDQEHAQWARGMSALRRADLRTAQAVLSAASPRTCDLLCGQAQLCLTQKRTDDARALLTRALALDRRDARVTAMLGDLEESAGHLDQAVAFYRQALDLEVSDDAAWYGLGLVFDRQNNRESALADYAQALAANPNNPSARLNLAADEADLGQNAKAAAQLQDYEERFPTAGNIYAVDTALAQLAPESAELNGGAKRF